ncbi:hypothetical protein B0H14DRAFT_3082170 [Mycena olivaceomarginata]|nr:hypothetical protein B0H14DRAFT_3082170 [Mycena olivaceomarginata]
MTADELDARIRTLPPAFGTRHFVKGISPLSQISGSERKAMARILLGCLIGRIPSQGITACCAILDFIYLAQYSTHDDGTLAAMQAALDCWHKNRNYFIVAGVRQDFNIPKFHSLLDYIDSIRFFATTDNYNTEMQEAAPPLVVRTFTRQAIKLAKTAQSSWQELSQISQTRHAPSFVKSLKEFMNRFGQYLSQRQLQASTLPFSRIDVYYNFKFEPTSLDPGQETGSSDDYQTVISRPADLTSAARFDTVIARVKEDSEATGLTGMQVGRVKVLFKLPQTLSSGHPAPPHWPKYPLAFVEWFSSFKRSHENNHEMYAITRPPPLADGSVRRAVIPLTNIRQTCQLFPNFGKADVNQRWTSDIVLDECNSLFVNNWTSLYAYQSIW